MRLGRTLTTLLAVSAVALAGCGSDEEDAGGSGAGGSGGGGSALETDTITYGTFSTGLAAREVLVADELGYFEDAGLHVEFQNVATTAALIPLLASDQVDLAYLSYQPAFSAVTAGVDVQLVDHVQNLEEGVQALYVASDSDIQSVADLKGRRVAVNAVGGYGDVLLGEALAEENLTLDDVELVEVQFPNVLGALEQGEIDAGWMPSSFIGVAEADPAHRARKLLDYNDVASLAGLPQGGNVAPSSFIEDNPNTIAAFKEAVQKAADHLAQNPDYDREEQVKIAGYDPAVGEHLTLGAYVGTVEAGELQRVVDLMKKYDQLSGDVDVDAFLGNQG